MVSSHSLALPLFRRAFPSVPWIFLYRDPVEVLVSQLRMPGIQMVPGMLGADLFDLAPSHDGHDRADYCARVLARICEPVKQHYSKDAALMVNYRDLPQAVWINPPAKKSTAQDAPGTTIVTAADLPVDPILDADAYDAISIIDLNASLITSTLVSQCP
jgi:hypothetical protein